MSEELRAAIRADIWQKAVQRYEAVNGYLPSEQNGGMAGLSAGVDAAVQWWEDTKATPVEEKIEKLRIWEACDEFAERTGASTYMGQVYLGGVTRKSDVTRDELEAGVAAWKADRYED